MPLQSKQQNCRLCDGALTYKFSLNILQKYNVKYFECEKCGSLQTEKPYWLEEAYKNNNLSNLDTGAVQRNINNFAASYLITKLFNAKNIIDLGGGDGLLCRFLRDYGINCFVKDKFAVATYAQGYTNQDFNRPDLLMAFEVMEHYPEPLSDLNNLFQHKSNIIIASTALYTDQKKHWWYLAPQSGQHVFFYSIKSLEFIAAKYNYNLIISGGYILFIKNEVNSSLKTLLVKILLKPRFLWLLKIYAFSHSANGAWKDHIEQGEKASKINSDADK